MPKKKVDDVEDLAPLEESPEERAHREEAEAALARGEEPKDTRTAAEKRKDAADAAAVAALAPPTEPSYTDGPTDGKVHRILVWQEGETTPDLEYLHEHAHAREVTIGGQPYDHANTAPDGTWVYRADRKN